MNLQLIKSLAEQKRIPIKQVAATIGMSESNLHRCVRLNKIKAEDLESIARLLDVGVDIFYSPEVKMRSEHLKTSKSDGLSIIDKVSLLEQQIKDKDAIIAEKERTIQIIMRNLR